MVKKYAAVGAVLVAVVLVMAFYPTEERKIRKLLRDTAGWASKEGGENPVAIAARSKKANRFFAPEVDLAVEKIGLERSLSVDDVERGYLVLMRQKTVFKVKLADVGIEITGDEAASAEATVLVESEGGGGEGLSNVNEVAFGLHKGEEGWRISGIRVREVLER